MAQLLTDLKMMQPNTSIDLFADSQPAIFMAKNVVVSNRSKHVDVKFHFIRECVLAGKVTIHYLPTEDNAADILTKVLDKVKTGKFRSVLMGLKAV